MSLSQEQSSLSLDLTPPDRVHMTPRLPAPVNSKPSTKHFSSRGASWFCMDLCLQAPSTVCGVFSVSLRFQLWSIQITSDYDWFYMLFSELGRNLHLQRQIYVMQIRHSSPKISLSRPTTNAVHLPQGPPQASTLFLTLPPLLVSSSVLSFPSQDTFLCLFVQKNLLSYCLAHK